MKKNIKLITTIVLTASLVLSGCSLSSDQDAKTAEEYVSDTAASTEESTEAANADSSIVVVENLFEPLLEEITSSAESSTVVNDTATSEDNSEKIEMVFFGDSQFANGRSDGSSIPDMIATRVPNSVSYNLGIGGTTAALEASTNYTDAKNLTSNCFIGMVYALAVEADRNKILEGNREVLDVMNRIDARTVDYYFIEYGANDFFTNVALNKDQENIDTMHSYYDALKMGIEKLKELSPNAKIIIVSPFYSVYKSPEGAFIGDSYVVSNGIGTLANYAEKAKNVSEDLNTWFFDAMFISKCDLYLDTADQYLMDGVHLTLKGRQVFGRLLAHIINYEEDNEPFAYLDTDFIKINEYNTEEYYRYDEALMKAYYPESWEKYIRGEYPLAQPSEEALSWTDDDTSGN